MLPANRHLLPVLGIDIHIVMVPTPAGPVPVPIPHPYIGITFDPMDYIPHIGSTVSVNNIPRGISLTNGMLGTKKHIPIGGPAFQLMPLIGHNSMNFFGSLTVKAQGSLFAPAGFMVMTCNDFGVPLTLSPPPGKKFLPPSPSTYLPTSATIPIPAGKPVMVGGPYVPDLAGMLMSLVMSFGFGCLLKKAGQLLTKLFRKFECTEGLAAKLCKMGFEPVDLITGRVVYNQTDFEIPGPLPIKWERNWYSDSGYKGPLGHGTHLCYDMTLLTDHEESLIGIILPDGRATAFPMLLNKEQQAYHRAEKLTLTNKGDYYELKAHEQGLTYTFTAFGGDTYKPTRIASRQGGALQLSYNSKGVLDRLIDGAGRVIRISHDDKGRITAVTAHHKEQTKRLVQYGYNDNGDLAVITDALGKSTVVRYEDHLMVEKTDRNGNNFYWEYEGKGRSAKCSHTWGDNGVLEGWISYHKGYNKVTNSLGETSLYYYSDNKLCTKVVDPLGHSVDYEYTEAMELYREIDEEGNITGYVYDSRGNLKSKHLPDNTSVMMVYNEYDQLAVRVDPKGQATVYTYYDDQLVKSIIRPDNSATHFEYNEHKKLASVTNEAGLKTRFAYDADQNLAKTTLPGGEYTEWFYDVWGQCVHFSNPERKEQSFQYDVLGRVTGIRSFDNNHIRFQYDAYDNVLTAEDNHHTIRFSYNSMDSLVSKEDNGRRIMYTYDTENRLSSFRNEFDEVFRFIRDQKGDIASEIGFDGVTRIYERDRTGKLIKIKRPGDRWSEYEYDLAGRVVRSEHSDGSWQTYSYDRNGLLTEAGNENGVVRFLRDAAGRVIEERSGEQWINSEYDKLGRRVKVTSSMGTVITQDYTTNGDIQGVEVFNLEEKVWDRKSRYNDLGLEVERLLPGNIQLLRDYDPSGRLTRQRVSMLKREQQHRSYSWDVNNRLTRMLNELTSRGATYGYDDFGYLAWAKYENGAFDLRNPDAAGNLYKTEERTDRQYGPGGRLLKTDQALYDYDEEGNLTGKRETNGNTWAYSWKANGMLKEVTRPDGAKVLFEYDALGRRTAKIYRGKITRWLWNGNVPLHEWTYAEKDKRNVIVNEFGELEFDKAECVDDPVSWIFDENSFRPAAKIVGSRRYSIITDHLGSPMEMYDETGQKSWQAEYDIRGKIRNLEIGSLSDCPFRFPGQYADEETGLYYNRFRYYAPEEGVFISQDPIRFQSGDKFYLYLKNPLATMDPLGLEMVDPSTINYSQAYVTGETTDYEQAMKDGTWDWNRFPDDHQNSSALKVAEIDGQLVSFDNRRLLAAQNAGLEEVPIVRVNLDDIKPGTNITWGKSLKKRLFSSPGKEYPKIQLPEKGTPDKPKVVCK